jgi:hypothetical protein
MLVILTDNHILTPKQVCQSCVLADTSGEPRWHSGKLSCGHALTKMTTQQPELYKCTMVIFQKTRNILFSYLVVTNS